jgi:hypothetical protein
MRVFSLIIACLLTISTVSAQKLLTAAQLQADFVMLQRAYKTLHPGLYKYADSATIDRYFADCQRELNHDQSLTDAYLSIMKLTARFKCGHSYPNFYNQEREVKALFERPNALPFWFRLVENRMIVTQTADAAVPVGMEVTAINGVPVVGIIRAMLPLVRADGSNDGKRLNLLQVGGQRHEYFDVLLPMLFPTNTPVFSLKINDLRNKKTAVVVVNSVLHSDRDTRIKATLPPDRDSTATFRWLDDKTALMQINTFANWNNSFKFGKFYNAAVTEFNQRKGQNLIVDIRKNEGGDSWNGKQLIRHLITKPIVINEQQDCWAYVSIDSSLSQYIDNQWAYQWRYRNAGDFVRLPGGQFRGKKDGKGQQLDPHDNHLTGRVFLLTSATNSSAAWQFATVMHEHNLATLVGQETGGNQKGITAGALFFMILPNSRIEVDVPLIGMDYAEAAKRPDMGIRPDVPVKPAVSVVRQGQDQELDAVRALLARKN